MAQLKDIKTRIDSVQKTRKMTQAMKMVAAAKFRRASDLAVNSRLYTDQLESLLATLQQQADTQGSPLLSINKSEKEAIIIVSGDRGLCGGFNANIIKQANIEISEDAIQKDFFFWGVKAYQSLKNTAFAIKGHSGGLSDKSTVADIQKLAKPIIDQYIDETYSSVKLIYTSFKSATLSIPIIKQILPIKVAQSKQNNIDYFIDPNPEQVLDILAEDYVNLMLYRGVLESFASEQRSRMVAMDSATDNAKDMINALKLQYNRLRQAQITTELSEIVAGAEVLVR
jgi:F-type H+-transporting ATPase subunit gamma